jgi:hypothetical protein
MILGMVIGEDAIIARLDRVPPAVRRHLRTAIKEESIDLSTYIKSQKLSGQVLKTKTTHLRDSITFLEPVENENSIVGGVGSSGGKMAIYGRVHEYGGVFHIAEYERTCAKVFGRDVTPHLITVSAHDAHYPERSFMRSGLADRTPSIKAALEKAVQDGIKA